MQTVTTRRELDAVLRGWRASGESVAFVPTMGNLHAGHMRLVDAARHGADRVAVSIFVNPLQFNDPADLARYPRTPDEDSALLHAHGADLLYMPEAGEVYPHGVEAGAKVQVPGLSDILCGAHRPGHFTGVTTVVATLLNSVRPDRALFGMKDYQQLLVIRRMVEDLAFPVEIEAVDTARETDGLAMSSRNRHLSPEERALAPGLYQTIGELRDRLMSGEDDVSALEANGLQRLEKAGFRPEYISIRRLDDLAAAWPGDTRLIVLAAAWLGDTRLIDNLPVLIAGGEPR
jgi:pantoate--beta-alanine ligase